MAASVSAEAASLVAFFRRWAELQGWVVPDLHIDMLVWLADEKAPERVLMVFRGASKSTNYAVYKAWKLWRNRTHRSLVWSADGPTAGMLTADVVNVLRNHPWCSGILPPRPGAKRFWVNGARDARNASMRANSVESNATGARADDIDFDDIEVPGNIETPEARAKLRARISESIHIAVPGAQHTYIGTPHTHDSIYPERIAEGAAVLKIPLFRHQLRYTETSRKARYEFPHAIGADGLYVLTGIGKGARMMKDGDDYLLERGWVIFKKPPGVTIDICSQCAWPDRFTRETIEFRRRKTKTLNGWDSQYNLEAKPLGEVRLNPEKLKAYADEPAVRRANHELGMWLGKVRIVSAACRWDPSSGKLKSDVSSLGVILQDELGRRYWHRAIGLEGEIAEFDDDGKTIIGGQVFEIAKVVRALSLPRVSVETNGIGGFAPTVLKAALKQGKLRCGVTEVTSMANKNKRILEALEDPLASGTLWAHTSVIDSEAWEQMRDWNPAVKEQPDDHLDSLSGAITETPERIGRLSDAGWNPPADRDDDWRPGSGVHEVELEG